MSSPLCICIKSLQMSRRPAVLVAVSTPPSTAYIANLFRVFPVSLIALMRFGVLRVDEGDKARFFKDVEHGNPILPHRFHTSIYAAVSCQPVCQFTKSYGERRETRLLVICSPVYICNAYTGINPSFVCIQTASVFPMDFEHGIPPESYLEGRQGLAVRQNRDDL